MSAKPKNEKAYAFVYQDDVRFDARRARRIARTRLRDSLLEHPEINSMHKDIAMNCRSIRYFKLRTLSPNGNAVSVVVIRRLTNRRMQVKSVGDFW